MSPEEIVTFVQALKDNAQRLGLTWELRLATVNALDPTTVTFDGETEPLANSEITNIANQPIGIGSRVWVLLVPPAGVYVISRVGQLGMRARVSNNPTIPNNASTQLTWNSKDEQTGSAFFIRSSVTITAPVTALWAITAQSVLAGGGGTRNFIALNVTSRIPNSPSLYRGFYGAGEQVATLGVTIPLLAGDSFNVTEFQNSGSGFGLTAYINMMAVGEYLDLRIT